MSKGRWWWLSMSMAEGRRRLRSGGRRVGHGWSKGLLRRGPAAVSGTGRTLYLDYCEEVSQSRQVTRPKGASYTPP